MDIDRITLPSREDLANRDWARLVIAMNAADTTGRTWSMVDLAGGCFALWGARADDDSLVWVSSAQDALPYSPDMLDADDRHLLVGVWSSWNTDDGTPDWEDTIAEAAPARPARLADWPATILPLVAAAL